MNLYFSGQQNPMSDTDKRFVRCADKHYRLFSCHGSYIKAAITGIERIIAAKYSVEIMLDSGAFTAWSKGGKVELDDIIRAYTDMLSRFEGRVEKIWLINLDEIPAEKGRTATKEELEKAMRTSDTNFEVLRKRFGEKVLPVFHQDEPFSQLDNLIKDCSYICASPRNDLPEKDRLKWSQLVHDRIPAKVRTHGLAATGARMMAQVPWFSIDSATWISLAVNGGIILEEPLKLRIIQISSQSGAIREMEGHYSNLPQVYKDCIDNRIEEYGFTVEEILHSYACRIVFNRIALIKYCQRYADHTKKTKYLEAGLFNL